MPQISGTVVAPELEGGTWIQLGPEICGIYIVLSQLRLPLRADRSIASLLPISAFDALAIRALLKILWLSLR